MGFLNMNRDGLMPSRDEARVQREACAWLRQLNSGTATHRDLQGFRRWRDVHPSHGEAFSEARRVWALMPQAISQLADRGTASTPASVRAPKRGLPRRVFLLGSAVGAAGAAAAAVAVHPPLALWPSIGELQADYRTATGEQRELELAAGVSLQLNTQTALSRLRADDQVPGVRLVRGEVAVELQRARLPFELVAGAGSVLAQGGQMEVRHLDGVTCVTCIEGTLRIEHRVGVRELMAGQQLQYEERGFQPLRSVDVAEWSAWRRGLLIFRSTPLAEVIEEINRYRPGKVLLWAAHLREREVSGRFAVSMLDTVLLQIERSYGLHARSLPGGVLILS